MFTDAEIIALARANGMHTIFDAGGLVRLVRDVIAKTQRENPTPEEIAAAVIAHDQHLHDVANVSSADRIHAMRAALRAAYRETGGNHV